MIGIYSDKGVICFKFRKQKDGKKTTLVYYPNISAEGFSKELKRFLKDAEKQKQLTQAEKAINDVLEIHDAFRLTQENFNQLVKEKINGKPENNTPFFDYCERYFQYFAKTYTRRRAQTIRTCISKIQDFNPNLTFQDIDKRFYRDFMDYCADKGFSTNYTGSIIRDLKRILNYAAEYEEIENKAFSSFKKPMEEVYNIYLSPEEIQSIYNLKITDESLKKLAEENKELSPMNTHRQIQALDRARKLFVIGCCTGLRVENYLAIDPEIQVDLKGGFIHAIANKNGPKLRIPLHKFVREIYESGGWPEPISQQKLNDHIKKLGQLAGIKEPVIFTRTKGNKRIEYAKPKYKLIVTHTARRSFCSNLIKAGVPSRFVMAVSGHKTESSFNKYVQAVNKDILTAKLKDYDVWG